MQIKNPKRVVDTLKKTIILLIFLILIFILAPVYSFAQQGKGLPQNLAVNTSGKNTAKTKNLKAAGMDVYLKEPDKHHSIPAYLKIPFTKKGYHDTVVHLDPYRNGVIS